MASKHDFRGILPRVKWIFARRLSKLRLSILQSFLGAVSTSLTLVENFRAEVSLSDALCPS